MPEEGNGAPGAGENNSPAPAAASPAASNASPNANVSGNTAAPAENGGSPAATEHKENMVPQSRLNEIAEERRQARAEAEEARSRAAQLEAEIASMRSAQNPAEAEPDVFTEPDKFVNKRLQNGIDPIKRQLDGILKRDIEKNIKENYKNDSSLQKVFKTEGDLIKAIGQTAVRFGVKELTPEVMQAAYDRLILEKMPDITKASKELGIEEERNKAKILDGSGVPLGGGAPANTGKGKATESDKKIWAKMGLNPDEMAKKLQNAEYDSDGRRVIGRK